MGGEGQEVVGLEQNQVSPRQRAYHVARDTIPQRQTCTCTATLSSIISTERFVSSLQVQLPNALSQTDHAVHYTA